MADYKITIERGKEFQAKDENIYDPETFFYESYQRAARCVTEIIRNEQRLFSSQATTGKIFQGSEDSDSVASRELLGYPNNIIAFCAERGWGKTSAMTSFSHALQELEKDPDRTMGDFYAGDNAQICRYRYEVIERIDPTMMEDGDSLLKIVLSKLFIRVKECIHSREPLPFASENTEEKYATYNKLLGQFQKCFHDLEVLERDKSRKNEDIDELEQIVDISDSSNMRGSLFRLIRNVLNFLGNGNKSYLVLQIDDADLNIKDAYQIVDTIRRYLVLPHVIVLMATNMSQMETVVEQHFILQYQTSIQNGGMAAAEKCREIAERYLEKVIPGPRRIYLPDINQLIEQDSSRIRVHYVDSSINGGNDVLNQEMYYQEQLLSFLYQRTGILLLPPKGFLHNLLPDSLRGLSQFLSYFDALPPITLDYWKLFESPQKADLELWQSNLSKLETYWIENWAPVHLSREGYALLRSVRSSPDGNKHQLLLLALPEFYARARYESAGGSASSRSIGDYRTEFVDACAEYGLDVYASSFSHHISYSDVYAALAVLVSLPDGHRHYKLAYALRFYYTIRLHQLLLDHVPRLGKDKAGVSPEEDPFLSDFFVDILYKRGGRFGKHPIGIPYGHYTVDIHVLTALLDRNLQPGSTRWLDNLPVSIPSLCRWRLSQYEYKTQMLSQSLQSELKEKTKGKLVFNLFYPCLSALDEFSLEAGSSSELIGALTLLLNCDVQYMLDHALRHSSKQLDSSSALLRDVFSYLYSYGLKEILEGIQKLTGNSRYKNLFGWVRQYGRTAEESSFLPDFDLDEEDLVDPEDLEDWGMPDSPVIQETSAASEEMSDNSLPEPVDDRNDESYKALLILQLSAPELVGFAYNRLERSVERLKELHEKLLRITETAGIDCTNKDLLDLVAESPENGLTLSEAQDIIDKASSDLTIPELDCLLALSKKKLVSGSPWDPFLATTSEFGKRISAYEQALNKVFFRDAITEQVNVSEEFFTAKKPLQTRKSSPHSNGTNKPKAPKHPQK